jgi:PAS domain S-box-containing protein
MINAMSKPDREPEEKVLHNLLKNKELQEISSSDSLILGILEAAPDAIVIISGQGHILLVNNQTEKIFGYKRDELLLQPVEILLPEQFREGHVKHRGHYFSEPRTRPMGEGLNLAGRRKDGSEFPVEISLSPMKTQDGLFVISTIRDVTDRKRTEEELVRSNQHLSAILSSTKETIFTISMDGKIQTCNLAALEMLGYRESQVVGQSTEKFFPSEESFLEFGKRLEPALKESGYFSGELELKRANGEIFPAEFMVNALRRGEQELGVVAVARDITQRKRAEKILINAHNELERLVRIRTAELAETNRQVEEERDRSQNYLDVAGVMLVSINARREVTLINKMGCEVLGYNEREIVGKDWFNVFLPESVRSQVEDVFAKLMSGKAKPVEYYENPVLTRSGQEKMIAWHNVVLRDKNGQIYATLSSGEDITDKVRLEQQVRQSEKLAAVGQLTTGLAHEIGTPLNIIMGRAEFMLRRMSAEDPLRQNLESIIAQIERITKIVQQLLSFSRPKPLQVEPVQLIYLLQGILSFLEYHIQQQDITATLDYAQNLPEVLVDRDQIQQVFLNIILNAIQSMPQRGSLTIRVSQTVAREEREDPVRDQYLKIEVADTGTGIAQDKLSKVFDPFFSTKEVGKGSGLGLTVSYELVKRHGGWIDVKSRVGEGSVFTVYLPLRSLQTKGQDIEGRVHG